MFFRSPTLVVADDLNPISFIRHDGNLVSYCFLQNTVQHTCEVPEALSAIKVIGSLAREFEAYIGIRVGSSCGKQTEV
jgi:hypothetical protein